MEFYINMYVCEDTSGKKPHYRVKAIVDDVRYEAALWPNKSGVGFSGKFAPAKPREPKVDTHSQQKANGYVSDNDEIPF